MHPGAAQSKGWGEAGSQPHDAVKFSRPPPMFQVLAVAVLLVEMFQFLKVKSPPPKRRRPSQPNPESVNGSPTRVSGPVTNEMRADRLDVLRRELGMIPETQRVMHLACVRFVHQTHGVGGALQAGRQFASRGRTCSRCRSPGARP